MVVIPKGQNCYPNLKEHDCYPTSSVAKFILVWSMLFIAVNKEHHMLDVCY